MDEEQLEHKTSLAMAKEEERIYDQMNNEELVSPGNPQTPPHVYSSSSCSTSLSVNPLAVQDNTFEDIVDIQRQHTELSQIMISQQARSLLPSREPPVPMDC